MEERNLQLELFADMSAAGNQDGALQMQQCTQAARNAILVLGILTAGAQFADFASGPVKGLLGSGGRTNLREMKKLMSLWDKSTSRTLAESIRYHAAEHGGDVLKYLRKAANFNKRGARRTIRSDGSIKWLKNNGEWIIERGGRIVSYGWNP